MNGFEVWHDHGIGILEPRGDLDSTAATVLRRAIFEAGRQARTSTVLIVEDQVIAVSPEVERVLIFYNRFWHSLNGELAVVSTDGKPSTPGRISATNLELRRFDDLDQALIALSGGRYP